MKKAPLFSLVFAACALVASTLFAAAPARQSAEQPPSAGAADDRGPALLVQMCNQCHESARIVEKRRTKDDWQDVLLKMIEKGATGEEKEFQTLFEYLCLNHGEVRINNAPADEIMMTLGLTRKDAEAIVAYRTARGSFADVDALKKVPDIDTKKIDARKDALAF